MKHISVGHTPQNVLIPTLFLLEIYRKLNINDLIGSNTITLLLI
jgi:hypothetical protein